MAPGRLAMDQHMTDGADGVAVGERTVVRIRGLASSGAGLGDLADGRVVFVHRTAPGDLADVRVRRLHPRWGEAELAQLLEEGPERVPAACPKYGECGGCTLQHVAYDEQLVWKRRFVTDAMERIGKLSTVVPPVEPSPSRTLYRNRVTFTVRRLAGGRTVAGFHALRNPSHIVDVHDECLLPEPSILKVWVALREAMRNGIKALPSTQEVRVTLRAVSQGVVIVVKGGVPGWDPTLLLQHVPGIVSVWHHAGGASRVALVAGAPVHEEWGEDRFPLGGQAFLQVNREAAKAMVDHVLAQVPAGGGTAVDAYCGVGVYGRALARDGWQVTGIELDSDACKGARHEAPAGFTVVEGPVEEHVSALLPADLLILNPPRTGLQAGITDIVVEDPPHTIVYVSCNPATLARDAARLSSAFHLDALRAFDLFPQTSHVETVAVFRRASDVG